MKNDKHKLIAGILFLATLMFGLIVFYKNEQPTSVRITSTLSSRLFEPQIDGPLPNGEKVSFTEAQMRVDYSIPLPEAIEITEVWVSGAAVDPSERSIAIRFNNDILLIIHKTAEPPDWDGVIASAPLLRKIAVNGHTGIGADPGMAEFTGKQFPYPGSVGWWVDGLYITLYSDTLSVEDLLKVAETVR